MERRMELTKEAGRKRRIRDFCTSDNVEFVFRSLLPVESSRSNFRLNLALLRFLLAPVTESGQ
jgi:hypothetical protein